MTKTAAKPTPSAATRAEIQRIARILRQMRRDNGAVAQEDASIIIGSANIPGAAGGNDGARHPVVRIAMSTEAADFLADLLSRPEVFLKEASPRRTVEELTTQQAADRLGVSRPYLIKLLEAGKIPFRRVGHYRRIRAEDLVAFEHADQEQRRAGLQELASLTQEIGLDY